MVFQALREDSLIALTDSGPELANDPVALAAVQGGFHSGSIRTGARQAAEAAYPIRDGEKTYVVLHSQSLSDVSETVELVQRRILIAVAIAAPLAWLVGALAAMALAARIRRLERASRRIASGDFQQPVRDGGKDEIARLALAFDEMRLRLERTDRARREFIANASHELRTPLFTLGGFLELLEDEGIDPETRQEFLGTMRDQVARLTRLATDLLDLSRLDAGGVALEREAIDLGEVAATLAADFAPVGERRSSTVTSLTFDHAVQALADEGRVLQIGRALVDNALRHNPPGTHIEVEAARGARRGGARGARRRAADPGGRGPAPVRALLPRPGRRRGLGPRAGHRAGARAAHGRPPRAGRGRQRPQGVPAHASGGRSVGRDAVDRVKGAERRQIRARWLS